MPGHSGWIMSQDFSTSVLTVRQICPRNFNEDLNAMYDAEKVLFKDEILWAKYRDELHNFYLNNDTFSPSAAQRAEAFLRTLNI